MADNLPNVGPTYQWNSFDKAYLDYGNYISLPTRGFFATFWFFGKNGNIKEKYSQEAHETIEDKISLSSVHSFSPFLLAKKYGIKNQNNTVKTIPNTSIHKDDLSNPGIVTTNGNIIEPAVNCPAATDTSINARFWLIFNSSLFCSINNTLEKAYQLVNLAKDLPVVGSGYKWGNYDRAYEEYGNYIVQTQSSNVPTQSSLSPSGTIRTRLEERLGGAGKSQNQNSKLKEEDLLLGRTGLAVESDVNQKESNHQKKITDSYFDIDISPIDHSESSSSLTAKSKERIPLAKLNVNNMNSLGEKDFIVGKMITEPIQPADRFVKNPDDTLNQDLIIIS